MFRLLLLVVTSYAVTVSAEPFSPYVDRDFPTMVFWGDTHLHTEASMDAGAFGNRLDRDSAYRFAKGEQVTSSIGVEAKLGRPLDFLVIADHSDNMGFFPDLLQGIDSVMQSPTGRDWYARLNAGEGSSVASEIISLFSQSKFPQELVYFPDTPQYKKAWNENIDAAERHNAPGKFTAMIGYEWTSLVLGGNMHRVVIYKDGADKAGQTVPFTTIAPEGSLDPRKLWEWLADYEQVTGGDVLAIAHNGNLANGIMFPIDAQYSGRSLDRNYVENRRKWEPLYEVTQIKGDGETHPFLSPNDEFADYETWDRGNLDLSEAKTDDMLAAEYAREALKRGLKLEQELGTNPYQFGMIGSTDSHTSLSTTEEENFFGKHTIVEPAPERLKVPNVGWHAVASGIAAIWATGNTREELFEAMERREVYATTGPRISVRFFGGWEFDTSDIQTRFPAKAGYSKGVPMGGELARAPEGKAPTFLVSAARDPQGANLDRVQIIKGWLDDAGEMHERVFDVAWSGDRSPQEGGKLPPVGNTVDVTTATWANSIGEPELITVWRDPEFEPDQKSFYYVRVIEIPTPRWSTYDSVRFGVPLTDKIGPTTQERAYTSPIWYSP